ncbi:MAG: serine hydrolase [Chloroflexi bacterium]|nr:serine hydrolase [Chloroflexota bacterium]
MPAQRKPDWTVVEHIMGEGLESTFPAAALLVRRRDETLFFRVYGWLDPEKKSLPTRPDALFDLASLTKLFTATAFMTLVEAKRASLNASVCEVLPEFRGKRVHPSETAPQTPAASPPRPDANPEPINTEAIRFWHLLTHTSGLAAWTDLCRSRRGQPVPKPHRVSASLRRRRMDALLRDAPFASLPGRRVLYSDLGFIVLGEAIERLAGMRLSDYLQKAVLEPLGLENVCYNPETRGIPRERIAPTELCAWRQRRVWGEVHDENAACLGGVAGHAGLFATAPDAAALATLLLNRGRPLLASRLAAEMTREHARTDHERRGLGWKLRSEEDAVAAAFSPAGFGHTGFTGTSVWADPTRELVVVLLSNRVYYGRDPRGITAFRARLHQAVVRAVDALSENPS